MTQVLMNLVVDVDDAIVTLFADALKDEGYRLRTVSSETSVLRGWDNLPALILLANKHAEIRQSVALVSHTSTGHLISRTEPDHTRQSLRNH
jgi:hypothetical protein